MKRKFLVAGILTIALNTPATFALAPTKIMPLPKEEFRTISPSIILEPSRVIEKRKPKIIVVDPEPKVIVQSTPQPVRAVKSLNGVASWYCKAGVSRCHYKYSGGMYAAIRRDLLYLRGKIVKVTYGAKSIYVKLIDCNCGSHANLIDLYSDAFKKLAPLSTGRIKVKISW